MSLTAHSPLFVIIWITASILLGYLGRNRRLGSFGIFLISFFFSPVMGAIAILFTDPKPRIQN